MMLDFERRRKELKRDFLYSIENFSSEIENYCQLLLRSFAEILAEEARADRKEEKKILKLIQCKNCFISLPNDSTNSNCYVDVREAVKEEDQCHVALILVHSDVVSFVSDKNRVDSSLEVYAVVREEEYD